MTKPTVSHRAAQKRSDTQQMLNPLFIWLRGGEEEERRTGEERREYESHNFRLISKIRRAALLPLKTLALEVQHWSVRVGLGENQRCFHFYSLSHTGGMASAAHPQPPSIVGAGHTLMQYNGITLFFFVTLRDMRLNWKEKKHVSLMWSQSETG